MKQIRITIVNSVKAGHHYWFGLGLLIAFCIHQMQINFTQRSLFDQSDHQVGVSGTPPAPSSLRQSTANVCTWFHDNTKECNEMLRARLHLGNDVVMSDDFIRRRWLFLGDSTMKRLFAHSPIRTQLVIEPFNSLAKKIPHECWQKDEQMGLICQQRMAERCQLDEMFDLPYAPEWTQPDPMKFEGPVRYGKLNPYCTDCSGCQSNFLDCQIRDLGLAFNHPELHPCDRKQITYGGYMTIEFARDVEIQTPKYKTTQENIAAYLHQSWNLPGSPLVQKWGLPICVINTGAHDRLLEGLTLEDFIGNVNWYLSLFTAECSHIIWLSSTAPAKDGLNFPQTEKAMKEYNEAVKELLTKSRVLNRMSSYIDIFDASLNWPHADHIHMDDMFYHKFGDWMVETFMK